MAENVLNEETRRTNLLFSKLVTCLRLDHQLGRPAVFLTQENSHRMSVLSTKEGRFLTIVLRYANGLF